MEIDETTKRLFLYWRKAGEEAPDELLRFFAYYLCLNILMDRLSGESNDRNMKEWIKRNDSILKNTFYRILEREDFQDRLQRLFKKCPVIDERNNSHRPTMDDTRDFGGLLDVLYQIRCNLFHGKKDMMDENNKEWVKSSGDVLASLIEETSISLQ